MSNPDSSTPSQTAATDNALIEKLVKVEGNTPDSLGICTMWHRNPDGPEAAERIKSLLADLYDLNDVFKQALASIRELEADRQRVREALLRIRRGKYDGREVEHYTAYECRLIAMEAVALNPASKDNNHD